MADRSGKRMILTYRPIPFKVEYTVTIWGEYKQDAEYINSNIITRCNPLGQFLIEDAHMRQVVRVTNNGNTNQAEVDMGAKDRPKIIYEMSMSAEFSLPINERVVPTILGKVVTVKEQDTNELFDVYRIQV
jgi:hypothetical protein